MAFHPQPLFFLVLGLVVGTLAPASNTTTGAWIALCLALPIAVLAILRPALTPLSALIAASFAAGGGLATSARVGYGSHLLPSTITINSGAVLLEGIVISDPSVIDDEMRFDVVGQSVTAGGVRTPYGGRVRVFTRGVNTEPPTPEGRARKGDAIRVWVELRMPQPVRSPGGFDQAEWAMREGLHAFATCKSERLILFMPPRASTRSLLDQARDQLKGSWRHVLDPTDRAVTASMILGDDGALTSDTRDDFRSSGLLHLLVVSGSQVGALILGLRRLMPRSLKLTWPGCLMECVALLSYCALAGADNSIVRATVMAMAFAVAVRVDLHRSGANFLAAAILGLLALRPLDALDPGAQMSFAATLALVLFASPASRWLVSVHVPGFVADVLSATVVASVAVIPLTLIHFHRFSAVALPANLIAAPLAVILLYGSLVTAALDLVFTSAASAMGLVCGLVAEALRAIAHDAAALDPDWRGPSPPWPLILGLAGLIVASGWRRNAISAAALIAALTISGVPRGDGRLHLWFLDVGQGDSLLIETPDGHAVVVDAGPAFERFDAGERIVGEALWELGYHRIDFMAITHRHSDHDGGAPFLARHFAPRQIFVNAPSTSLKDFQAGVVKRGDSWTIDGVVFEILGPDPAWSIPARDENARSLVTQVRFGANSFLLLGDATVLTERLLDLKGLRRANVVKVGHHGAPTSSSDAFVRVTEPGIALISVGERNRFSHPSAKVVERWQHAGALVWRTDLDRTLHIASDGFSVQVQ